MNLLLAVAVLALMTFTGTVVYVVRAVLSSRNPPTGLLANPVGLDVDVDINKQRIDALTSVVADLTLALDDGIRRQDRSENRIQKTVASARAAVRKAGLEHAGIDAEFDQLEPPDDPGIEALPAVSEEVAGTRTIRIPGGELMIGVG